MDLEGFVNKKVEMWESRTTAEDNPDDSQKGADGTSIDGPFFPEVKFIAPTENKEPKAEKSLEGPFFAPVVHVPENPLPIQPLLPAFPLDKINAVDLTKEQNQDLLIVERQTETLRVTVAKPVDSSGEAKKIVETQADSISQKALEVLEQTVREENLANLLATLPPQERDKIEGERAKAKEEASKDTTNEMHVMREIEIVKEHEQVAIQNHTQEFKLSETVTEQRTVTNAQELHCNSMKVFPSHGSIQTFQDPVTNAVVIKQSEITTELIDPRFAKPGEETGLKQVETKIEREIITKSDSTDGKEITIEKEIKTELELMDLTAVWKEYVETDSLSTTMSLFNSMKGMCELANENAEEKDQKNRLFDSILPALRKRVHVIHIENLWQIYEKKMSLPEYDSDAAKSARVIIVGGGPGGLRAAIELACLGCKVVIMEKRRKFSRNNLVHVWPNTKKDLLTTGAKIFYPKLCAGGIEHIAIRALQLALLKIALLLGVKFLSGVSFIGAKEPAAGQRYWTLQISNKGQEVHQDDLLCDVLIGADGEGSRVATHFEFEYRINKFSLAIGVTANFTNTQTPEEMQIDEFGLLAAYKQDWFAGLRNKYGIDLENLVYYRAETHYFVMTVITDCLVSKGVARESLGDVTEFLGRDNINIGVLERMVQEVAEYVGLPNCEFAKKATGANDVSIFDFSKKRQSLSPGRIVFPSSSSSPLLVSLVGDALLEPFWPLGTGVNRAFLAGLDATWMIRSFASLLEERGGRDTIEEKSKVLLDEWTGYYKQLVMVDGSDKLNSSYSSHTIDPSTRYKKNGFL